jgi:ATP-dependent helicase/nuclease subunit B
VFAEPVSPSAFESYLSCPFAFYLRYVLGLRVPDEPDEALAIEPVDLGQVVHEILQGAYAAAAAGGAPTRELALAGLDEVAPQVFARAEARGLTGFPLSWRVVADELLADLRRVVSTDPCWDDGVLPQAFEWSFGGDEATLPELQVGRRLVRFRGRIDRVDESADGGRVRLVDYKTGKGKTEADRVGAGHDVQLPVYVLALLAARRGRAAEVGAEYRMVRRQGGFKSEPLPGDPDEVREGLRATLAVAVAGIDEGFYPRLPDPQRCRFCDSADACGADRIAFAAKADDPRLRPLLGFEEPPGASADEDAP